MYLPMQTLTDQIDRTFKYHKPGGNQADRYEAIREQARTLAMLLATLTPGSREQSTALTKLEECVMFANAAIARNETWDGASLVAAPPTKPADVPQSVLWAIESLNDASRLNLKSIEGLTADVTKLVDRVAEQADSLITLARRQDDLDRRSFAATATAAATPAAPTAPAA